MPKNELFPTDSESGNDEESGLDVKELSQVPGKEGSGGRSTGSKARKVGKGSTGAEWDTDSRTKGSASARAKGLSMLDEAVLDDGGSKGKNNKGKEKAKDREGRR